MKRLITLVACALGACATPDTPTVADGRWQIREIAAQAVADDMDVHIEFLPEGRVAGRGGCNRYTGSWGAQGRDIRLGRIAATRMACAGPGMSIEALLFGMLEQVVRFDRPDADTLVLVTGDGRRIVARRMDAAPAR